MLRLRTLGSVFLTRDCEVLTGAAGQRRLLAILAVLAAAGERGISRDQLLGLLWAEGEPEKSRHALTQSLYHIRTALRIERIFLSGATLRLNPDVVSSDVGDFERALFDGRHADAAGQYGGPFLDGFYLNGDPAFEFWVATQRDRLARSYASVLDTLALRAHNEGDARAERRWRSARADHDPLDGASVAQLLTVMIAAGDHAGALQRARSYETRMQEELELPPDDAVVELMDDLRRRAARATQAAPIELEPTESAQAEAVATARVDGASAQMVVTDRPNTSARRVLWGALGCAAAASMLVARVARSHLAHDRAVIAEQTILVTPFAVDTADATAAYVREGLLDLLSTRVADADTKRVADPAHVLHAWREAGFTPESALSVTAASRLASSLDADEAVTGSVRAEGTGIVVEASLIDVPHARIKSSATVRGSADSLMTLADRVMAGLILPEAGESMAMSQPPSVSATALRAYVAGRIAYREGNYHGAMRAYTRALADNPNFALAAFGLALSADHANAGEQHDRSLAIAWTRQAELPPADRAFLRAFAGPRYPEPSSASETLDAWEHAVRVAPDRADGWYELGESFYYDAEVLGLHDGPERAAVAFQRALKLDSSFAPSRRMMVLLLARRGDTAALRRLVRDEPERDTADAMNVFMRWRVAMALHEARWITHVRRDFNDAPASALRAIAMTSQFDGVSTEDGDRALEILRHRPLSDAEQADVALARHSRALTRGDYAGALAITTELGTIQPALHPQLRLRVLDGLYGGVNRGPAAAAAATLERFVAATRPVSAADSALRVADLCVIGQWRLSLGDTSGARAVLRPLRDGGAPRVPVGVAANPLSCAELIDASLAIAEFGKRAQDRLAHLDSLMLSGPAVGDAMRYANMVVAREYDAVGDPRKGLAALQRRSYMRGWPRYKAMGLRLQIRLATELGDTAIVRSATERLNAAR